LKKRPQPTSLLPLTHRPQLPGIFFTQNTRPSAKPCPKTSLPPFPEVKKVCAAFKIPVLVIDGFEADDIIGTVARRAEETGGIETFMVTPDKDFAQLVTPHTAMWKPGRQGSDHEVLTYEKILKNWEIDDPKQVIDILGLWGDSSDNIPGVPGIGEKTAKKLVSQYGSVEGLLENTDKLKGKQKENVTNFSDQARLSKELATIITDVPIEESLDDFKLEEPDEETLKSLFEIWEFRTLTKRLFGDYCNDNDNEPCEHASIREP
jgi:DNA polymerase-1